MADFPEKENKELEDTEEVSTIFSDPAAHNDTNVKSKKLLPKILAGVLAVCVLIGSTVAVIKLIPVLDDGSGASSTATTTNTITVKKADAKNVEKITILKGESKTEIYNETKDDKITWYTGQVDKELTDSESISAVVTALTDISATREITQKTASECGLEEPVIKATVTFKDGKSYEVAVGEKSPDNSGYYLSIADKIYLVSDSVYTTLNFNILDFANTDSIPGFGTETEVFDTLIISGKNFPQSVKIIQNEELAISEYYRYLVVSPQKRLAKGIETVFPLFQEGVLVAGAYSYDVSSASLEKFGLNNPDLTATMTVGSKTITYKFTLQEDGDYAAVGSGSKLIHRVAASNLSALMGYETVDFYENTLFTINIDDISQFVFETKGKTYTFDIAKNEDEDSDEKYNVVYNGKKIKSSNFQNFYRECISLTTQDHTTENIAPTADMAFRLKHKSGAVTNVIFTKVNDTRYQANINGIDMGKVTANSLNNISLLAEKLIKGEKID